MIFRPSPGGNGYFGQGYRYEQVMHYRYWIYIAIKAIMDEVAGGAPPNIGRIIQKSAMGKGLFKRHKKSLGGPKEHEGFEPYEYDHPLVRLFANPNGPDTAYDFWSMHMLFKKLTGQSHWWVIRNEFGVPVEMWVVPTHWMRLVTGDDGQPSGYQVQSPFGFTRFIPFNEIVTFYETSPLSRYEGWGATQACAEWEDTYESLTRMRLAVFKNGAVPNLHIQLSESHMDPSDQFIERFYAKWNQRFQGENYSGRPLITGADVDVKGVDGHRPADALTASNQSEEQIRDMVLCAFRVPKGVVGLEPTNDTSAYAPYNLFFRGTINHELTATGQVATEKIIRITPNCEDGVCYWHDRIINPREQERAEQQWDLEHGVITPNEFRLEAGRDPYPHGGNNPIINGQEFPWVEDVPESSEFAKAFEKQISDREKVLSGVNGHAGGYLEN